MQRALPRPIAVAVALGIAAAHCPTSARADETDTCIDASVKGQELRDAGKLLDARAKFLLCSREPCPGLLQRDCAAWLANLDARLPSVVISAQDPDGHDTALVKVT